eukprot:s495_g5.t1
MAVCRNNNVLCNPCVFHNSLLGCDKGRTCGYCHFDHNSPPTGQNRPRKITRDSFKRRVLACFQQPRDQVHAALQAEALHPYAQGLIRGYLDAQAENQEEPLEPGEVTNRRFRTCFLGTVEGTVWVKSLCSTEDGLEGEESGQNLDLLCKTAFENVLPF